MNELVLSGLYIYPIKSAHGIAVPAARVLERGLEHDRRFMVVDEAGHLVTARQHPKLLTVKPAIEGDALIVAAPGMPALRLPLEPGLDPELAATLEARPVRVWADWMPGLGLGAGAAGWFSELLGAEVRLVWMPEHAERRMNPYFGPARLSFADGNPLHLVNEASVEDLEARVGASVGAQRFRPNLVVRGALPYAEDGWARIRFADLELRVHEPCARCMIVNLAPESGALDLEPLRTLARYRRQGRAVLFGQHLHTLGAGELRVGQRGTALTEADLAGTEAAAR